MDVSSKIKTFFVPERTNCEVQHSELPLDLLLMVDTLPLDSSFTLVHCVLLCLRIFFFL